jgi:hypothetical protein
MKKILLGIVIIVVCLCIFSGITGHITNSRIQKRIAYWKTLISEEIPIGTTKERMEQWGKQRHLNLTWIPSRNFFDTTVERVPDAGIGFPCSEWNIIIDIQMGNNGTSAKQKVHSVGSCV